MEPSTRSFVDEHPWGALLGVAVAGFVLSTVLDILLRGKIIPVESLWTAILVTIIYGAFLYKRGKLTSPSRPR